ncbi:MAG TPA: hypothetical protein VIG07_16475 [Methylomirabilota bacterium]
MAVGSVMLVALCLYLEGPAVALRGDQQWGNLMALKHLHPDWLQGDLFFGPDYFRGYNPAFFSLQARIAGALGGDPEAALRLLVWPVGMLFFVGHYVLFRSLTGSWMAAALGAVSAMTVRHALGGEYWGFGGLRDVLPRAVASGLTPLFVLAFLRLRERRLFAVYFLLLGGMANLHPVSGLHLAMICGVAHLWLERFRGKAWRDVLGGAALFTLAVLPFVLRYFPARENVTDPALLPIVRQALHVRYDYLLYPLDVRSLLSVAFHAALPAGLFAWGAWVFRGRADVRVLTVLGVASLGVGLVGTAAIQTIGSILDRPYLDVHQLRATRFMYASLLAGFPLAFLWLSRRRTRAAWVGLAILAIVSLVPPHWLLHSVLERPREVVKRALGLPVDSPRVEGIDAEASSRAERELWRFVAGSSARNELFFTDSFAFRYETRRPITGSFKDGGIIIAGTAPFYRWYVYMREVRECREQRGQGCWLALARRYGARNAITDPDLDGVTDGDGWVRSWSERGWAVWSRPGAD